MTNEYDLVVLGGGTGGYVAAIRASQLGMKVAVVEKNKLGGTCLHQGCIPSKALLRSAEVLREAKKASSFGVEISNPILNFPKVQERKENIVEKLYKGVQGLMKKGKIDIFHGIGRILGSSIFSPIPGTISVEHSDHEQNTLLNPKFVLIATGSKPRTLPGLKVDGTTIMSSDEALHMENLPKSIIIVGGGVIGVEWASLLADFGVKVHLLEYSSQILPTEEPEISRQVVSSLEKRKVHCITNANLLTDTIKNEDGSITVNVDINGQQETYSADKMLLSVGRDANTSNIGLSNTSIILEDGYIQTNEFYQTAESHIYAIGDVIGGLQLAHVASHEAIKAVEHMVNANPLPITYENVPTCVYSFPEVARVGLTERQAKEQGLPVTTGKFFFNANGKALIEGDHDGFVKIIANKQTDDIIGIHMVGPHVTDMISEAGLAKFLDATPWEMSQSIHPHPSLTEVIGEAALAVDGKQIHG